jgi:hypothetical protein
MSWLHRAKPKHRRNNRAAQEARESAEKRYEEVVQRWPAVHKAEHDLAEMVRRALGGHA